MINDLYQWLLDDFRYRMPCPILYYPDGLDTCGRLTYHYGHRVVWCVRSYPMQLAMSSSTYSLYCLFVISCMVYTMWISRNFTRIITSLPHNSQACYLTKRFFEFIFFNDQILHNRLLMKPFQSWTLSVRNPTKIAPWLCSSSVTTWHYGPLTIRYSLVLVWRNNMILKGFSTIFLPQFFLSVTGWCWWDQGSLKRWSSSWAVMKYSPSRRN